MKNFRIVFLGAEGVGKTSLIRRFVLGDFTQIHIPTLGDCYRHLVELPNGLHQRIEIVDTTGDPQFPAMRKLNIQNGDAFVLVYTVTDIESFRTATALSEIILELKGTKDVPIVLVGNKIDLNNNRKVPTELAFKASAGDMGCSFIETSARCNLNVACLFRAILLRHLELQTVNQKHSGRRLSSLKVIAIEYVRRQRSRSLASSVGDSSDSFDSNDGVDT